MERLSAGAELQRDMNKSDCGGACLIQILSKESKGCRAVQKIVSMRGYLLYQSVHVSGAFLLLDGVCTCPSYLTTPEVKATQPVSLQVQTVDLHTCLKLTGLGGHASETKLHLT